ncbi:MAG: hypothetical protein E6L09_12575 [Verrucomicrobia bacterium]|nr:MAG: hypothetical protein E6L09_12575 [Verrucomicrobiota bacterium]
MKRTDAEVLSIAIKGCVGAARALMRQIVTQELHARRVLSVPFKRTTQRTVDYLDAAPKRSGDAQRASDRYS